jgi:hypothetical protein
VASGRNWPDFTVTVDLFDKLRFLTGHKDSRNPGAMAMANIYEQHDKAFKNVSAYVILDSNGEHVASVKFKFPHAGAGRLWAYLHWFGIPMVRGFAGGYGYDKRSAAVANAVKKAIATIQPEPDEVNLQRTTFFRVLREDDGEYWDNRLRAAGFTVLQAV